MNSKAQEKSVIVNILDFGAQPNSSEDTVIAVQKALGTLNSESHNVVEFPRGNYHFYPQDSVKKTYFMSNTTDINPKNCGILIERINNIEINGNGSTFIFHDRMSSIVVDHSQNVTIKDLNIDWARPLGSESRVVKVTKRYIDIELDKTKFPFEIKGGKIIFKTDFSKGRWNGVMEFDPETRSIPPESGDRCLGWNWDTYQAKIVGNNIVRLRNRFKRWPKVGNFLVMRHHKRDHAGIFIWHGNNVRMENINMYSNAGLGILTQYSKNISLHNVNVLPNLKKYNFISGHDDGVQISNCAGEIFIENCVYEGLMDDPINCHGTSVKIIKRCSSNAVEAQFMHEQSLGMMFAENGDKISFIDRKTMETVGNAKVKNIISQSKKRFIVEFERPLPKSVGKNYAMENLTWTPNLTIKNCKFLSCRARGILISTPGDVLVEKNYFKTSGSAILVAGDANGWYESGAVKNVLIRDNIFSDYCLSSIYQFCEGVISIYPIIPRLSKDKPFHSNIRIEKNKFEMFDYPVLYACSTINLIFNNNKIERSHRYSAFHKRKALISLNACKNVSLTSTEFIGDVLGKNVQLQNMNLGDLDISESQIVIM